MPFFWKMSDDRCLEGIVDLAFYDPATGGWLIIDWKTNRVAHDKIDMLRGKYRAQLAAYSKVIGEMTGGKVTAAISSTANGKFIHYESEDLVNEWTRLQTLPADKFFAELKDDA